MKLIIAGGRDYQLSVYDYVRLESLHLNEKVTAVVCGGTSGADACGLLWARSCQIPVRHFSPDWKTHGKKAGPLRNRAMAEYADAVALFPGGRGTESMYQEAVKAGIKIFDFRQIGAQKI